MTSRGPLPLAALASAAVPGLDPSSVEGVVDTGPAHAYDVAFVQDHEHRRWVIRSPRTPAASARLEQSAALLALLTRRLTMPVPAVKGWVALPEGGRAAVHPYLTGRLVDLASIAPGSQLAAGLGRTLAHLHNLDRRVYEEAGAPVYEAEAYRTRRLAELDRAAATGRVPTGLLTRWERTLENLSLWRFTTTPTHGAIGPTTVLATPDDGSDPDVKSLLGWESAQVADPADDLAALVAELHPETLDTVLEAYAHARVDRPDRHLQRRAHLVHEMQLVRTMMAAVAAGDDASAEDLAARLRRLDDRVAQEETAKETAREAAREDEAARDQAAAPAVAKGDQPAAEQDATSAAPKSADDEPSPAPGGAGRSGTPTQPVAVPAAGQSSSDGAASTAPSDDANADDTDGSGPDPADGTTEDSTEDDDAVEVGDPGEATPVHPAGSDGAEPDAQTSPTSGGIPPTEKASTETAPDAPASEEPPTPQRPVTRDHATDEIVALTGDEGDDVLPPSPRR